MQTNSQSLNFQLSPLLSDSSIGNPTSKVSIVHPQTQRNDFFFLNTCLGLCVRSVLMAWEVILWVIFFTINVALIASNLYQIVCLTDLEADYMNPYDSSARINTVVVPEMVVHGIFCVLFLVTAHWFLFLLTLPIFIYNAMLYSKGRHLIYVTDVFRSIDAEKKYRIVKLGFYLLLFVLVIIGMVIAIVNNLIDDQEEVLHGYGIY